MNGNSDSVRIDRDRAGDTSHGCGNSPAASFPPFPGAEWRIDLHGGDYDLDGADWIAVAPAQ